MSRDFPVVFWLAMIMGCLIIFSWGGLTDWCCCGATMAIVAVMVVSLRR